MDEWLKIIIPLAAAIAVWSLNEWAKLRWEQLKRKQDRYQGFLESVNGFYVSSQDASQKEKFIQELRLAWLYCPDEVIKTGNAFLDAVTTGAKASDEDKEQALADFKLALRRDLYGKTKLTLRDLRILRSA